MEKWIEALLNNSILMSFVILLFILISSLFSKKRSAKWRYYTWLIIIAGLLIPIRPNIGLTPFMLTPPVQFQTQTPLQAVEHTGTNGLRQLSPYVQEKDLSTNTALSQKQRFVTLPFIISIVGVFGCLIALFYYTYRHWRFTKYTKRWIQPMECPWVNELFAELKKEMGITDRLDIKYCKTVSTPLLVGLIKPTILLPLADFEVDEMQLILKHELIHFKRKDLWYKTLALFTSAVHWFNPFVHMMVRAIASDSEMSCDEVVLKGQNLQHRMMYGETIIGIAGNCGEYATALSTGFRGGKKMMEKRLSSIMDTSKKKRGSLTFFTIIVCTMMTGFVTPNMERQIPLEPSRPTQPRESNTVISPTDYITNNSFATAPLLINYSGVQYDESVYQWPGASISIVNTSGKAIANYEIVCLAYDKEGTPLELYWDARNVAANGEIGSVGFGDGVDYGIVTDISPVSPKSYSHIYKHILERDNPPEDLIASLTEQFGRPWVDNWLLEWRETEQELALEMKIAPMEEPVLFSLLFDGWDQATGQHIVEYILSCVRSVTFEDSSQWVNPNYSSWLDLYQGNTIDIALLENYYK